MLPWAAGPFAHGTLGTRVQRILAFVSISLRSKIGSDQHQDAKRQTVGFGQVRAVSLGGRYTYEGPAIVLCLIGPAACKWGRDMNIKSPFKRDMRSIA